MLGYGIPAVVPPPMAPKSEVSESLEPVAPREPEGDPHLRSSLKVREYGIHALDGEFGHVSDFVIDDADWRIRYLVIATRNWLPGKHVLIAPAWVERVSFDEGQVFINLPQSLIKEAPDYDPTSSLSRAFEVRLHDHYGRKTDWDAVQGVTR